MEVSSRAMVCSKLSAHIHLSRNGGGKVIIKATTTPARTCCFPGTESGHGPADVQAGATWPHPSPGQDPHHTLVFASVPDELGQHPAAGRQHRPRGHPAGRAEQHKGLETDFDFFFFSGVLFCFEILWKPSSK